MSRFLAWSSRLKFVQRLHRRRYDREPAPEFLFARRPTARAGGDRAPAVSTGRLTAGQTGMPSARLVAGNRAPHSATRREELVLRGSDVPTLTVTSDPSSSVAIVGTGARDWTLAFCAKGEGKTAAEAEERARGVSLSVAGGAVALVTPNPLDGHGGRAEPEVDAPRSAGLVIHGSYAYAEVQDMAGPVRVAATHARARVLDTTGQVDVTAGVIDFSGSRGRVTLSAEMEINLKMGSTRFEGIVMAWAQRSVRLLVPQGFTTPIEAVVGRRGDFVCRTEFRSRVKHKRQGELHIFTYNEGDQLPLRSILKLRSEAAAVGIDTGTR